MTESRDWFTPYTPVPEPVVKEDEFADTLQLFREEQ